MWFSSVCLTWVPGPDLIAAFLIESGQQSFLLCILFLFNNYRCILWVTILTSHSTHYKSKVALAAHPCREVRVRQSEV